MRYSPFLTLALLLLSSLFLWRMYDQSLNNRAQVIYSDKTAAITNRIIERMHDHEQVLRGAAGLFKVNEGTTRSDWRRYVSSLHLDENHPGILGVGFSKWLTTEEKEDNINNIRSEGFPEYTIRPAGHRSAYTSIIYLEPFNWRNQRAFGYDMYAEPVRRAAMDKARDGDVTTIAAKITLVQETDKDKQSGMLMYVPVYRHGMLLDSIEQRRAACGGFVYSPIRMNDFMRGTLTTMPKDIAFEVSVVGNQGADNLMFSSVQAEKLVPLKNYNPKFATSTIVQEYGCSWRFSFQTLPEFDNETNKAKSIIFLFSCIIISVLVSYLLFQILRNNNLIIERTKERADQLDKRLSLATNAARIGVWDWEIDENRLVWNEQMYALYGIPEEDFTGAYAAWQNGLHPDDKKRGDDEIGMALREEKQFDTEFRVLWPSGEVRSIKAIARVQRDAAGKPLRMIGVNYDITDIKQAERELRDAKETLSLILNSVAEAIYGIDMNGCCTFCNQSCLELLGYESPEEVLGKNMHDLIHHTHRDGSRFQVADCLIFKAFELGVSTHVADEVLWRKDGASFPAEYWSYPQRRDGNIIGAVVTFLDITVRRETEESLLAAMLKAEAANIAKSEFLATMSHEIRTPMNGVIGMTGLLLDTALTDEQRGYAEIVGKSGENLLNLINDILDFSKIEAHRLELELLDFDVRVTLEDTAEMLDARAAETGLELICQIDPGIPSYLRGDPGRLRQIIINLAGNAIKFTPSGEVVISATLKSETDESVELLFEVADTGIGIPESRLAAIFEPFTQADGSTTRKYGGTGLGLAICKQLTELMGGEIGFTSEVGRGSTFRFTVRFQKPTVQGSKLSAIAPRADIAGEKVLVVDDNATNRTLMSALLHGWGCRVETADGGETALVLLYDAVRREDPFRIALLDQQMPGMSGSELCRRIKAEPLLNRIQLVLVTSQMHRGDAASRERIGFAGYLPKPVRQAQLQDCISLALGRTESSPPVNGIVTRHTVAEAADRGLRILLAEDNITNQKVARHILGKLGYKVDVAPNGVEAVRALGLIDYDLVLMDCQMPEMNGFEATTMIRDPASNVLNHQVPIIAMTANAMKGDREQCIAAGIVTTDLT